MLDSLPERYYNPSMMNKEIQMNPVFIDLDQAFLIDDLATICSRLPARDNVLAGMLIKWFDNHSTLSVKQLKLGQDILERNRELVNA